MALITAATAREYAAKAVEAKKQAAIMREQGEPAKPLLPDEKYRILRLSRVRRQLDKIDEMIASEPDPQKLDRLASAQMRLAEQERQLSGRSLPPTIRPAKSSSKRPPPSIQDQPEPVRASTVQPALPATLPGVIASTETGQTGQASTGQ